MHLIRGQVDEILIGLIDNMGVRATEHLPIFNYGILHNRKGKGTHIDLLRTTTAHEGLCAYANG